MKRFIKDVFTKDNLVRISYAIATLIVLCCLVIVFRVITEPINSNLGLLNC
jgi:hypothetical protein